MTTVVLDNKDLTKALTTGENQIPAEVVADNAAQAAKREEKKAEAKGEKPKVETKPESKSEGKPEDDDVEGEDGLTPRQKREFTTQMLKAIGKKHAQLKEAEEFAAAQYNEKKLADQRAENLQRQLDQLKTQTSAKPADPNEGKPQREKFETEEAYRDAMDDWRVDQKFKAKEAEAAQKREQERIEEIKATASARITKALELVPDFQEVTEAADIQVPPHIAGYMQESEMLAELGYHFAKHPDVLERLAKMNPMRALVEVGKIESKLEPFKPTSDDKGEKASNGAEPSKTGSAKSADPSKTGTTPSQSRAPVITPVTSSSASQVEKSPQEMNIRETIATWQKKRGVNLERRKRH
jgi:hypothetical protein